MQNQQQALVYEFKGEEEEQNSRTGTSKFSELVEYKLLSLILWDKSILSKYTFFFLFFP